jgi:GT2 family glycosyltransferase
MIYLIHENNRVIRVLDETHQEIAVDISLSITKTLFILAEKFPEELIIWCRKGCFDFINEPEISKIFHHKYILASYSVSNKNVISEAIGYVDQSVFINIKKNVTYPTWLMSSDVGGIYASFLVSISKQVNKTENFSYFLNSLAKLAMPKGLFCYSEPKLLKEHTVLVFETKQVTNYELFKFVKQHYKWVWTFTLFVCFIIYEKRIVFLPFIKSLFYKRLRVKIEHIKINSHNKTIENKQVDVIIPTIGRKKYLYDVLKDLSKQTILPTHVIIVEQNPLTGSTSDLDYLKTEFWPFNIKHVFTHQSGACNARNIGLSLLESEWCFFADDDIKFESTLIETTFHAINKLGVNCMSLLCLQEGETTIYKQTHQTGIFGSGNTFVKTSALKDVSFNMALEFGYGEDFDFGVQLRNKGIDVVYFPDIKINHLKAPIGGFRTKVKQQWEDDLIQPKPSPTIMYIYLKHSTKKQILSYKLVLFLKLLKKESIFSYVAFFKEFKSKWTASQHWANKLD